jgi:hypothetical protein
LTHKLKNNKYWEIKLFFLKENISKFWDKSKMFGGSNKLVYHNVYIKLGVSCLCKL